MKWWTARRERREKVRENAGKRGRASGFLLAATNGERLLSSGNIDVDRPARSLDRPWHYYSFNYRLTPQRLVWNNTERPTVVDGFELADVVDCRCRTDSRSGTKELTVQLADRTMKVSLLPMQGCRRVSGRHDRGVLALAAECPGFMASVYDIEVVVNQREVSELLLLLGRQGKPG
jgi:hypothetical protein